MQNTRKPGRGQRFTAGTAGSSREVWLWMSAECFLSEVSEDVSDCWRFLKGRHVLQEELRKGADVSQPELQYVSWRQVSHLKLTSMSAGCWCLRPSDTLEHISGPKNTKVQDRWQHMSSGSWPRPYFHFDWHWVTIKNRKRRRQITARLLKNTKTQSGAKWWQISQTTGTLNG